MQHSCSDNDHKDKLILDSRQTAWVVSALLLLFFFVFMVGYFLGKRQSVEQFSHALDQESISDKIYSSLYASYEGKTGIERVDPTINSDTTGINQSHTTDAAQLIASSSDEEVVQAPFTAQPQATVTYYAPLIGFGSQKAACAYVQRLLDRGFPVELKTRTSKTAKGRIIHWYQVVTTAFTSRDELEKFIDLLEKREHLTHIKIATVTV